MVINVLQFYWSGRESFPAVPAKAAFIDVNLDEFDIFKASFNTICVYWSFLLQFPI